MITLTIVADTPEEIRRDVQRLFPCGMPAAVPAVSVPAETPAPAPAGVLPMKTIIENAKGKPAEEAAPAVPPAAPAEETHPAETPTPAPAGGETAEPPQEPVISEAQAVELRVLCEKFCARDAEGKKKIQHFLRQHGVARITAMPVHLLEDFRKLVAA